MCANFTNRAMRGKSLSYENNPTTPRPSNEQDPRVTPSKGMARITVIARKRPLTHLELKRSDIDIVKIDDESSSNVIVEEPRTKVDTTKYIERHEFLVDRAFSQNSENAEIYNKCVKNLIDVALREKAKISCFAYGQTGSGKTYTMLGPAPYNDKSKPGIFSLAAADIFNYLNSRPEEKKLFAYVSFYEIYCGKLFDLLQKRKMVAALENGKKEVIVKDLKIERVDCEEDLVNKMIEGSELRKIGANSVNYESSRSHAILQIDIKSYLKEEGGGKIMFIDLAGSERGADTMYNSRSTQIDGAGINSSLLALKECIRAMDNESKHVPFRNSELTKVLRDIFVGRSHSIMIVNVSPASSCCEQTLNTLRYATRVKNFRQQSRPIENITENDDTQKIRTHTQNNFDQNSKRQLSNSDDKQLTHTKLPKPTAQNRSSSISHTNSNSLTLSETQNDRYRNTNRHIRGPTHTNHLPSKSSPPQAHKENHKPTPHTPRQTTLPDKQTRLLSPHKSHSYTHTNIDSNFTHTHTENNYEKKWNDNDILHNGAGGTDLIEEDEFNSLPDEDDQWIDAEENNIVQSKPPAKQVPPINIKTSSFYPPSKITHKQDNTARSGVTHTQKQIHTPTPRLSKFGYLGNNNIIRQKGGEAFTIPTYTSHQSILHTEKGGRNSFKNENFNNIVKSPQYYYMEKLKQQDLSAHTRTIDSDPSTNEILYTHAKERSLFERGDTSQLATTSLLLDAPFENTPTSTFPMSEDFMEKMCSPAKPESLELNEFSHQLLHTFKNFDNIEQLELRNLLYKHFGINTQISNLHLSELSMFGQLCYRARQRLLRHLLQLMQPLPTQYDFTTERYIQKLNNSERIGDEINDFMEAYMDTHCTLLLRKRQIWAEAEQLKNLHKAIAEEYQIKSINSNFYEVDNLEKFITPTTFEKSKNEIKEDGGNNWFSISPLVNE